MALTRQFLDEAADAPLVLFVRTLQIRDLIVHQRFQFAGPAKSAAHGIVHERHLTAHGLTQARDRLFCRPVRLGKPDRHFRHGGRSQGQRGHMPVEQRQQPQNGDRHQNSTRRGEGDGTEYDLGEARTFHPHRCERVSSERQADDGPHRACDGRDAEDLGRRLLFECVDQAADARHIVVCRDLAAHGACGTAARDSPRGRLGRLGVVGGRRGSSFDRGPRQRRRRDGRGWRGFLCARARSGSCGGGRAVVRAASDGHQFGHLVLRQCHSLHVPETHSLVACRTPFRRHVVFKSVTRSQIRHFSPCHQAHSTGVMRVAQTAQTLGDATRIRCNQPIPHASAIRRKKSSVLHLSRGFSVTASLPLVA